MRRARRRTPRRSPPRVPREETALLMASLLQRAPRRLSVVFTGPTDARSAASVAVAASGGPSRRPTEKPPALVRSKTPGVAWEAPKPTMAPRTRAGPPTTRATRSSGRPFGKVTSRPSGARCGRAERAAAARSDGWVARKAKSKGPEPAGRPTETRPGTARAGPPTPVTRKPWRATASATAGLRLTTTVSTPASTRWAASVPPMPPQPRTSTRGPDLPAAGIVIARRSNRTRRAAATRVPGCRANERRYTRRRP